jgi:AcrR family transcriptional regulator
MSEAHRVRTPSTEVEGLLLEAADALLEAEGPDSLSVRRIAREAGVAPMGVYNHFDSKSGIIDALLGRAFDRLHATLEEARLIADPLEALLDGGRRYRELALARPQAYRLMFMRVIPGFEPSDASKHAALRSFGSLLANVEFAVASRAIPDGDPLVISQAFWAATHGWVSLELLEMCFVADGDAGAEALRRILIQGLRAEEPLSS